MQAWRNVGRSVGTSRDYKTQFKLLHRGLWTPHRAHLAKLKADDRCLCGAQGTHEHIFLLCMFIRPLLHTYIDLCDHLYYYGAAKHASPKDILLGTINGKPVPPGLALLLDLIKKFFWIEYCKCMYGDETIFKDYKVIWSEIVARFRKAIIGFAGVCSEQVRMIRHRAGRGIPALREYRLKKYVIPEWNRKLAPFGELTLDEYFKNTMELNLTQSYLLHNLPRTCAS